MNPKLYCFACMHGLETEDQRCPRCGHDNRVRVNGKGQLPFSIIKNRYLIGKALGRGGFGVTYMGLDLSLDRRVAIKEYFPSELVSRETGQSQLAPYDENSHSRFIQGRERSMEEARTIARLNDVPAAVNVYDVFLANDTLYIVMEYIEGETLRARVKAAGGKLPAAAALTLLHPVFGALSQIHRQGIVHRDVSPDNIMLRASTGSAVLLDFGAAHSMELDAESEHSTSLRPGYAPVEQYSRTGLQDARTDEYALCATIYFAITGQKPVAAMERAFGEAPLPLPRALGADISPAAEAVLMKGLSVQAKDRYPDIATLEAALDAAMGGAMGGAVAPQPTVQPMPFMPRMQPTQPAYGPSDSGQTVAAQAVSAQSGSAQPPRPKKPLGLIVAFGVTACAMLAVLLVLLLKPGALPPGTAPTSTQSAAPATATAKATATATATATMAATPEATATPTAKAGVAPTPGWSYTNAPWASATPTAKAGLAPTPGWSYTNAPWATATPTAKAGLAPTPGWS
ncbi:MAG: serine/threonine protein kinase, partial [Clostridiales bacterium]|nr:serine/threonine protein kinase [Clostridiales bacterium]